MSEKLTGILLWDRASRLFDETTNELGLDQARQIFRYIADEVPDDEIRQLKNLAILQRLDAMQTMNVAALAREMVEENDEAARAGLPPPNGPRGSRSVMTMDKHVRNLITEREEGLADGSWVQIGHASWPKRLSNRLSLLLPRSAR
jgi:hypothetical protein